VILSTLVWLPLAGALAAAFLRNGRAVRAVALAFALFDLGLALFVLSWFDPSHGSFQFKETVPFLPQYGVSYALALDGISLWLVLLTAFLTPLVVLGSFRTIQKGVPGYYACLLLMESAMLGTFLAVDLFWFYLFWELMLIPMFFLIGLWGGEQRVYATVKFVLFTLAGSLALLVALLAVAHEAGTFSVERIMETRLPEDLQLWCFLGFALAFLIKVPMVPFHTWLPDAHTEAPAGASVILAGVLLKMGAYGFLRFSIPLFPDAARSLAPVLMVLAVVGIVHGALAAATQPDLKRLVAYSSVSHMGFVVLGVFTFSLTGLQGGMLQVVNHGVNTGALFFLVGMLYDRRHTRLIADFGGLARPAPLLAAAFLVSALASVGLPGLNAFVGEFMTLLATFTAGGRNMKILAAVSTLGVVFGAWYLLSAYGRVFFGPVTHRENEGLKDLTFREGLVLLPLLALMLFGGLNPGFFLRPMEKSLQMNVMERLKPPPPMTEFAAQQLRHQQELEERILRAEEAAGKKPRKKGLMK
jgi:NADH-quinone oxidoreductase subunit M